jgi:DNA-directed RNA polymerase specialized sigma24 family protein
MIPRFATAHGSLQAAGDVLVRPPGIAHGADAEDVSQEVFVAAAAGLDTFRRDRPGDTFRGWLRGITRNKALLLLRRNEGKAQAEGGSAALAQLQDVADPLAGPIERKASRSADSIAAPSSWCAANSRNAPGRLSG